MKTLITRFFNRSKPRQSPPETTDITPQPLSPAAAHDAVRRARDRNLSELERSRTLEVESFRTEILKSTDTVAVHAFKAHASTESTSFSSQDERPVSDVCRRASSPRKWAEQLFHLIREAQPHYCLEMGTSLGVSAAYQAEALRLNGHGQLLTLERRPEFVRIARNGLVRLSLTNTEVREGDFQTHFPDVAWERPWNFVFIDGHHDEEATQYYFSTLLPHVAPGALLVFDDITWSDGMKRAWRRISEHQDLFATENFGRWGICVVGEHATDDER